jgi:hypothetical protein
MPGVTVLLLLAAAQGRAAPAPSAPRPGNPKALALIDKLVTLGGDPFDAAASRPRRELVAMGVAALPDLLDHLSDRRETKLLVKHDTPFGAMWHSDEYDPRSRDPRRRPAGVHCYPGLAPQLEHVRRYTLRVGDLCYWAVGLIVNRNLYPVRGQATACLVINSPVYTPALAAAARKDWSGLTREQLRRSLVQDVIDKGVPSSLYALERLYAYYPDEAERLALRLLRRPWYDHAKLLDFIMGRLVKEKGPRRWRQLIAEFAAEQGRPAADMVPYELHWIYCVPPLRDDEREGRAAAARILAEVYPGYDPYLPPFIDAANVREQTDLIESLSQVKSGALDRAIAGVFRSLDPGRYEGQERVATDDLVLACMDRLAGTDLDARFKAYCVGRIKELQGRERSIAENQRLEKLRDRLRRMERGARGGGRQPHP